MKIPESILVAELIGAAESAENTLRGMSQLADTFDNEDDGALMLQKADRLRDAIAKIRESPDGPSPR